MNVTFNDIAKAIEETSRRRTRTHELYLAAQDQVFAVNDCMDATNRDPRLTRVHARYVDKMTAARMDHLEAATLHVEQVDAFAAAVTR